MLSCNKFIFSAAHAKQRNAESASAMLSVPLCNNAPEQIRIRFVHQSSILHFKHVTYKLETN